VPQRINKQIEILAGIESKGHFFAVRLKMFCADFMRRAHDARPQERERRFYGVRVDAAPHVHAVPVLDRFVPSVFAEVGRRSTAHPAIVSEENVHILADVFANAGAPDNYIVI